MGLRADLQKLVLFFAAGGSVFLVAMALGMRSVPFLVGASVALLTTVTTIAVTVLRADQPARVATDVTAPARPVTDPVVPAPRLHEEFTEVFDQEATVRTPPPSTAQVNGHDPEGYDPADFETARLAPSTTVDPIDSEIEPIVFPDAEIPLPRAEPTIRLPEGPAARGGTGLDAALPVADVARSVRFYRGVLGLTVTYSNGDSAVVESDGLRLLLDRVDDPPARAPRVGAVHLEVTDIEETYRILRDLKVPVTEPPALIAPGTWRARLRDPDGHEVELLEYPKV